MFVVYYNSKYQINGGFSFEDVLSVLIDDGDLDEQISSVVYSIPSIPIGSGIRYGYLYDKVLEKIRIKYHNDQVFVIDDDIIIARYNVDELMSSRFKTLMNCEQGTIYDASYSLSCLSDFLESGRWHFGIKSPDGIIIDPNKWPTPINTNGDINWGDGFEPTMWFGLDGEPPIKCWSFDTSEYHIECQFVYPEAGASSAKDIENWKLFWFNHFWSLDWNVLWENDEGSITWAFYECGMDEPVKEFEKVKSTCPVPFNESDSFYDILSRISRYCYNLLTRCNNGATKN